MARSIQGAFVVTVAAALLSACGNSDPNASKARANAPLAQPKVQLDSGAANADANEALRDRLARQEAASKLFEKARPEPPPAPVARAPEPARAEPPKTEPVKTAAAPVVAPPPAAAPVPAPAKAVEAPKYEPPKTEPPRTDVASARPAVQAPAPAAPTGLIPAKMVARVDPEFPREAIVAGADRGLVKARMTLDANGNVTRVEVVDAQPRRVFDRAVVRALSQWRFSEGPSGRTVETEVEFKR